MTRIFSMGSVVRAALLMALAGFSGGVRAQTTDLLLVLAADVSRSIDESEFALQREGYSAALTDPRVLAAIRGGSTGTIAICFVEWSGAGEQNVVADWTVIHDERRARGGDPCRTAFVYGAHLDQRRHRLCDGALCRRAAAR
jgi:Protein of unknown function (DUF1194)